MYFLRLIKPSLFSFVPTNGTYFQLLSYDTLSEENDLEYAQKLTKQFKLASIPLSPFYFMHIPEQKYLRFCFAKKDETLIKAAEIINKITSHEKPIYSFNGEFNHK